MFKFKKKVLIYFAFFCVLLLFLSALTPALRASFSDSLKFPFNLIRLIRRQVTGVVFYHRNLVQNQSLKKKVDLLTQRLNTQKELALENQRLKKLLALKQKSPFKVISAQVIARSPDSWSAGIIIDKGTSKGIKRGMPVISFSGLVGRVVGATKLTSQIILINDLNLSISGIVQRSRQEGVVSGTLGAHLIMKYLPEEADIKKGDAIITSGLNKVYPKGILIGSIIDIGQDFSGLSRYAIIKPAVNLSNIEEVLLIIP